MQSTSLLHKKIIHLNESDYRTINEDLNLGLKRLGKGIKEVIDLYFQKKLLYSSIKADDQVFIPSKILNQHSKKHYKRIRDSMCQMKGFSSHITGTCDLIVGWKPRFSDVVIKILKRHAIFKSGSVRNRKFYNDLPGADWTKYAQVSTSGRYYISYQNLSKEYRNILFKGCDDIDIKACYPSIFLSELQSYIYYNNLQTWYLTELRPLLTRLDNSDTLLAEIERADIYVHGSVELMPRERAKMLRSRLFNHKVNKRTGMIGPNRHVGCDWYDQLSDTIYDTLLMLNIDNSHLFFSTKEQIIIQKAVDVVVRENVLLNMHDGLILKPNTVNAGDIYLLNEIDPYIKFVHNII